MNERIEKLALQAREYADELLGSGLPDTVWQDRYHEKFAELIVRECIVDFYRNYLDITSDEDITVQVDRYVKEHFGVEK